MSSTNRLQLCFGTGGSLVCRPLRRECVRIRVVERTFNSNTAAGRPALSTRFFGLSLLVHDPEFHPLGNLAQRRLQRVGNLPQPAHRRVDDPSLHSANIRAVEAALAAEALLRVA